MESITVQDPILNHRVNTLNTQVVCLVNSTTTSDIHISVTTRCDSQLLAVLDF